VGEAHVAQQVAQRLEGVELAVVARPAGDLPFERIAHRGDQLVEFGIGIGQRAGVGREVSRGAASGIGAGGEVRLCHGGAIVAHRAATFSG
jgi:hypothetical protein